MQKVNVPTDKISRFAGKWIVIDPQQEKIIAVGKTLKDVSSLVCHSIEEKTLPVGKAPFSFLVPRKDEKHTSMN